MQKLYQTVGNIRIKKLWENVGITLDKSSVLLYNKKRQGASALNEVQMAKFMLGKFRHQLDEKNRVRIPVKFREGLGATPYFLPGKNGCMYIVPEDRFEDMFSTYFSQDPYMSNVDDFTTSIFAHSGQLEEDSAGRITVDKTIKDKFNFKKEIVFVGKATYLEVWPAEVWDERYGNLDPDNISKMIADLKAKGV